MAAGAKGALSGPSSAPTLHASAASSRLVRLSFAVLATLLFGAGCEREQRRFRDTSLPRAEVGTAATSLQPGGGSADPGPANPYDDNAWALSEGRQLFVWFNCSGCHGQGGGGMGPALMDDTWLYGSAPAQIFATIVQGRPNGMPSFGGRLSDQQVWQLVAYVRSLSGQAPLDVASSRDDHMMVRPSTLSMPAEQPKDEEAAQ